ncbi:hypothetical protein CTAYLR_001514 [Chrysophaeum taylorii]|uniref:Uncharacterized protein n=1 Tax=Chrysophaeum taylorii TaxID=2483200 RepID=A0AAD7UD95_9STRA|nr:hypothetical protein CTAYLR_001514 [Chrysophaeum taylorii]
MTALKMLQSHLVRVKLQAAEREAELIDRQKALEQECARLRAEYDIAKDELKLCWAYVAQLKLENSQKWRIEERNDWKALVASIQDDRRRLRAENGRLRRRCEEIKEEDDDAHHEEENPPPPPLPPLSPKTSPSQPEQQQRFLWRRLKARGPMDKQQRQRRSPAKSPVLILV